MPALRSPMIVVILGVRPLPVLLRDEGRRFSRETVLLFQFPDSSLHFLPPGTLGYRQSGVGLRMCVPELFNQVPYPLIGRPASTCDSGDRARLLDRPTCCCFPESGLDYRDFFLPQTTPFS